MLNRQSVMKTFMAFFLMVSLIPILILGGTTLYNNARQAREQFKARSSSYLGTVYERYRYEFERVHYAAIELSMDENVTALASEGAVLTSRGENLRKEVQKQLYRFSLAPGIESVYLEYDVLGQIGFTRDLSYFSKVDGQAYRQALNDSLSVNYLYGDPLEENGYRVFPLVRRVFDDTGAPAGLIFFNIRTDNLRRQYEAFLESGFHFAVYNAKGVLLSSDEPQPDVGKDRAEQTDARSGLQFLCYAAPSVVFAGLKALIPATLLVCLLCFGLCLAASYRSSRWLVNPIRVLISRIRPQGGAAVSQEISYPQLIRTLQTNIDEYYAEQESRRVAEMKALLFQINPHFLYNTLSSVIWLCDAGENEKAGTIVKLLSNYFRVGVSKGEDVICLQEEISHVRSYLHIQEFRYDGRFSVEIFCPEELAALPVPKLILQPLVENSLYHGVNRCDTHCRIAVRCSKMERRLLLEVTDDAGGMDQARADEINRHLKHPTGELDMGIGVSNVHARLRLFAGGATGVNFHVDASTVTARITIDYSDTKEAGR